ncbi:ATP-binding protein [Gimibacter soli]|uniref:ATP-binding protein n=1 Tax=Gimibacter soli TaxID=3024400 RepID=A0AAE9XL05_9PROT|nr:ATP-binding protein [Gimibacter soli]WCL53119.1 ATP-binding protein [Gimibacter soli]
MQDNDIKLISVLERIANALEGRPAAAVAPALDPAVNAYVYEAERHVLQPVKHVSAPPLALVLGVDRPRDALLENTRRFARGVAANNALLWGARGMGKSTLVKAVHQAVLAEAPLSLVEIHREDIAALPALLAILKGADQRFIIFCDDLSFDQPDRDFKALKSVLEGGLEGRPDNVIFYATSNRRHLLPRRMMDQEAATGIHPTEAMDETIALSDRFGLWLGFYPCDQDIYLGIVRGYLAHFGLDTGDDWMAAALEWSKTRGNRSGRTAWQFVTAWAGKAGKSLAF